MQGWGWRAVHHPDDLDAVTTRWRASLASGEPFEMEFLLRGRNGEYRWFLTRAMPLRDEAGTIVRWFGTSTDVDTSRRDALSRADLLAREQRARLAAELASRAKDDFLSTASHELRTPLNAILGWARMLQSGQLDQSTFLRAIDTIERNARVQVRLIEDILDGSRIITGQLHLDVRPLDLTAVVEAAVDTVRTAAEAKQIALTVSADADAGRISGDPDRLQQVIWNLVTNAIKFTPRGGAVHVALRRAGTDVTPTVADDGEGIDPEFLPHVFDRFRQAEGSTARRHGGLGLGLALVRHLVEAHGGTVRVDSAGPGQGATFTVSLPVQPVVGERAMEEPPRPGDAIAVEPRAARLDGTHVLVVDDEADARDLVATALRARGAAVTVARGALEALDLVATHAFTAMVSDVGMPGIDGYTLIRRVRTMTGARGAQLPAVALTAYSRDEDRGRALEAGFSAYASKPVDPAKLVAVVASLVVGIRRREDAAPTAPAARADTLTKFSRVLAARGLHEALRLLNSRTAHRFTGIYRFDGPMLRSLHLVDAEDDTVTRGEDAPVERTFCSIVGSFERPFTTDDTLRDDRLRTHPGRDGSVRSYCGVLLRGADGSSFGTLCHFDMAPCDVPVNEVAVMDAVAPMVMRVLSGS
ncbi:MAG: ATP-binding protein [Vicinamibacterales bacterium]